MSEKWSLGKLFKRGEDYNEKFEREQNEAALAKIEIVLSQLRTILAAGANPQLREQLKSEISAQLAEIRADLEFLKSSQEKAWDAAFFLDLAQQKPSIFEQVETRIQALQAVLAKAALAPSPELATQRQTMEANITQSLQAIQAKEMGSAAFLEDLSANGLDVLLFADKVQQLAEVLKQNQDRQADAYSEIFTTDRRSLTLSPMVKVLEALAAGLRKESPFFDKRLIVNALSRAVREMRELISERQNNVKEYNRVTTGYYYVELSKLTEELFSSLGAEIEKFTGQPVPELKA